MERAGPGGLVRGGRGGGRGDPPPCARRLRSARGRRPLRADAWRDPARRRRQAAEARHPLERRPLLRRVSRAQAPRSRRRKAHRQSRHARLHRAEDAVGRRARAGHRQSHEARAPAQRLRAPAPLGRSGVGHVGRVRHVLARRRAAALGRGPARRDRPFACRHAEARRGVGGLGASLARDRDELGPRRAQDSDRGRRRRQCGLGDRRRRDRAGAGFVSLGTSGVVFSVTDRYVSLPERTLHAFCHALPHRWHGMSVMLSAASVALLDRRRARPRARHRRARRRRRSLRPVEKRGRLRAGLPALSQRRAHAVQRRRSDGHVRGPARFARRGRAGLRGDGRRRLLLRRRGRRSRRGGRAARSGRCSSAAARARNSGGR